MENELKGLDIKNEDSFDDIFLIDELKMSSEKEVVLIKEKTETDEVTNEKSKTKKGKKIKINTNKCRGEINLIRMIIKKRGWKEVFDSKADIFWSGLNLTSDDFHNSLKLIEFQV